MVRASSRVSGCAATTRMRQLNHVQRDSSRVRQPPQAQAPALRPPRHRQLPSRERQLLSLWVNILVVMLATFASLVPVVPASLLGQTSARGMKMWTTRFVGLARNGARTASQLLTRPQPSNIPNIMGLTHALLVQQEQRGHVKFQQLICVCDMRMQRLNNVRLDLMSARPRHLQQPRRQLSLLGCTKAMMPVLDV